jgi:cell division initiation protein
MFLSPPEIQQQKLKSRLGSYDREDVDELLGNVAASYERVWHERDASQARVVELEHQLRDYEELERLLRDSLVTGQRAAEEVKAEAVQQAQALLEEARKRADVIVSQAKREREGVKAEIGRLRSVEQEVQERCRALLVGALDAIGQHASPPEPRSPARDTAMAAKP